uniref:F-box domain-containing protein n=1 Tax=Oryza meridionalis TaxID=40149 RepID=A0A0E0DTC6_9ORYZ
MYGGECAYGSVSRSERNKVEEEQQLLFVAFLLQRLVLHFSATSRGERAFDPFLHFGWFPMARIHADPVLEADQFDRLPDSLVLVILNNVEDVRSLGRCSAVSKRFYGLVPLVHDVYVKIDRVVTVDGDAEDALNLSSPKPRNILSHFLKMMLFTIIKPFHSMRGSNGAGRPLFPQLAQHSPAQVLRNFMHIRNLRVELPSGDVGTEEGVLLKWRAEYGSTLQNCVILGGTQVDRKPVGAEHEPYSEDNGSMPESFYTNGGLKLRVVWTISSLIAASTRHFLLRSIIKDHPTLTSLVLTDADGQGTLSMGAEQLKEFRENQLSASACSNRTQVPACNMKLKYAPYLELPGGIALQGATLVAIKPSPEGSSGGHTSRKETDAFVSGAFDGPFKFAVKALMKRRTYLLEMNGF